MGAELPAAGRERDCFVKGCVPCLDLAVSCLKTALSNT